MEDTRIELWRKKCAQELKMLRKDGWPLHWTAKSYQDLPEIIPPPHLWTFDLNMDETDANQLFAFAKKSNISLTIVQAWIAELFVFHNAYRTFVTTKAQTGTESALTWRGLDAIFGFLVDPSCFDAIRLDKRYCKDLLQEVKAYRSVFAGHSASGTDAVFRFLQRAMISALKGEDDDRMPPLESADTREPSPVRDGPRRVASSSSSSRKKKRKAKDLESSESDNETTVPLPTKAAKISKPTAKRPKTSTKSVPKVTKSAKTRAHSASSDASFATVGEEGARPLTGKAQISTKTSMLSFRADVCKLNTTGIHIKLSCINAVLTQTAKALACIPAEPQPMLDYLKVRKNDSERIHRVMNGSAALKKLLQFIATNGLLHKRDFLTTQECKNALWVIEQSQKIPLHLARTGLFVVVDEEHMIEFAKATGIEDLNILVKCLSSIDMALIAVLRTFF